jgi:hypothetical protein
MLSRESFGRHQERVGPFIEQFGKSRIAPRRFGPARPTLYHSLNDPEGIFGLGRAQLRGPLYLDRELYVGIR